MTPVREPRVANATRHNLSTLDVKRLGVKTSVTALAVDLGTTSGFTVARITPTTCTTRSWSFCCGDSPEKYLLFYRALCEIMYTNPPDIIFYEHVGRHLGTFAAHAYGAFLGCLKVCSSIHGIVPVPFPVGTIKKVISGKGNADKQEVVDAVNRVFTVKNGRITDFDEADSMAIMYTGIIKNLACVESLLEAV